MRPITAARWSTDFARAGRRSIRAAISACSVSGIRSTDSTPSSASIRIVSSTNSGLPSVLSSNSQRASSESCVPSSSASTSCSLSSRGSDSSSIAVARTRPPPQPGRRSSSSGRARQISSSGASRTQVARCSISSSSGSSAQWMSSKTSTSGCSSASRCAHSRAAQAISCALASDCTASSTPEREPEQVGDGLVLAERAQLVDRDVERVVVGDAGRALDHLGERPVGDALAVGQAAAGQHRGALDRAGELAREPALPHAGLAVHREQVRAAVAEGAVVGVLEQLELGLAADERRLEGAARPLAAGAAGAERAPGPDRLGQALEVDRADVLDLDAAERQPVRAWAEQELPGLGELL